MSIERFSNDVINYGGGLTLKYLKNDNAVDLIPTCKSLDEVTNGLSFLDFVKNIVVTFDPDQLIATVKKSNGTSWKNPQQFYLSCKTKPAKLASLSGVDNRFLGTQQNHSPMDAVWNMRIDILNDQIKDLKESKSRHKKGHSEYKKKYQDLKFQYNLIEKEHELDKERDLLSSKNSLAGLVDRLQPTLEPLITSYANNLAGGNKEAQNGVSGIPAVSDEETKLKVVLEMLKMVNDSDFEIIWELIARFGQINEAGRLNILELVQAETIEFNESFESFNHIKSR